MKKWLLLTAGLLWCGALARADGPVVAPLAIPEVAADDAAIWAGVTSGQMSAERAWQDGLLDAATVQTGLAHGVASGQSKKAMQLRRELGALLIQNAPAVAAAGATLPMGVQLALADAYASIGDERAAPLYEAVIVQTTAPYEKGLRLLALGKFWSNQKQPQKAQEVFARGHQVLLAEGLHPHFTAEMLLLTARVWSESGESDKARQFYVQTALSPDASMASAGVLEWFGKQLLRNPKQAEAQLLQLQGREMVPEAHLATQFLLAWAKYQTQDWAEFLTRADLVLQAYEQVQDSNKRRLLALWALKIEDAQKWARLWQTNSIVAETPALDLKFDGPLQQPVERRIFVDTPTPMPLQVTVTGDANRVSARLEESPWAPELADMRHQKIVVVVIAPGVAAVSATIRVASAEPKALSLNFPVTVSNTVTGGAIQ